MQSISHITIDNAASDYTQGASWTFEHEDIPDLNIVRFDSVSLRCQPGRFLRWIENKVRGHESRPPARRCYCYTYRTYTRTLEITTLSHEHFTILSHPAFPGRSIRIKKSKFCDGDVKCVISTLRLTVLTFICTALTLAISTSIWSIYFFYFFESRNDPATDDVVLWTNGGCSLFL